MQAGINMLSEEEKSLLEPQLKLHVLEKDWDYIDIMIDQSKITDKYIVIPPVIPRINNLCMLFDRLTCTFVDIGLWNEYNKK